jgi:hypothetical protein
MPFALPTTRLLAQWTEEQELPFEQRRMLQCEFQEGSDGNTKLLLVLADSAMLRRATILLNNQPVFSDTTFSIVRYKLSFLTLLGLDEEGHGESLLWAFLPDETEETFTRVRSSGQHAYNVKKGEVFFGRHLNRQGSNLLPDSFGGHGAGVSKSQ